jgi:CRISPR/Cas system-associated exonuclease Cas4 (RecB family)
VRAAISVVARALSGEASCLHRVWWELRNPKFEGEQARLVAWKIDHAKAVREVAQQLTGPLEAEVPVAQGDALSGRIDLVEREEDLGLVVHEVKTGRATGSDLVQLMLYMKLLAEKRQAPVRGVLHRATTATCVPMEDVPTNIVANALEISRILNAPTPPPKIQERACMWCRAACPFATNATTSVRSAPNSDARTRPTRPDHGGLVDGAQSE